MPYNPNTPASIFTGDNLRQFCIGLNNAYALRHGIPSGDLGRDDVGVCMKALSDVDPNAELKTRPVISTDCRYNDCDACEGSEAAIWPDGDQSVRKCSCTCHEVKP